MTSLKTIKSLEFDKISLAVSEHAVLSTSKDEITSFLPLNNVSKAQFLLNKTLEAYKLLFNYNVSKVFYFYDVKDSLKRVDMGGTLIISDILRVVDNLKSARLIKTQIKAVNDETIKILPEVANRLYVNQDFEKEIANKIISEDELSDNASPKLASIRKEIRTINAKIRDKLNSYMRGSTSKYLQDGVVTMRQDRYVIPVKAEYRSFIKGFVHDQSSSGSTVFIEPDVVIEYNNELKHAVFEEMEEVHKILYDISREIASMSDAIRYNIENLTEIDVSFARAEYSFMNKCSMPILNDSGKVNIIKGRHPLIDKDKVVPVSLSVGVDYNFLLITGPNTGGKTVTLKLLGLLSLMSASGLFIPADSGSEISIFSGVYTDIGDEQSIEQSLSTFSSHIVNLINILNEIDNKALVLIDEIGAGTDPEEGSALALSLIEKLLDKNCFGIITTHYSKLKEFASLNNKIENASMQFDAVSLKPLYKLNVGIPGSSNAIEIAKTLGLDNSVINRAYLYLSDKSLNFENVLKKAEKSNREAEELKAELEIIKQKEASNLKQIEEEKEKLVLEREKINKSAKTEVKRIVADRLDEAEEIIDELKKILRNAELESKELFRAGELKNRLRNSKYLSDDINEQPFVLDSAKESEIVKGNICYVKSLGTKAEILAYRPNKKEVEVLFGEIKTVVKLNDVYNSVKKQENKEPVKVNKNTNFALAVSEINVIGKTSLEALFEVKNFLDQAIVHNLSEVKIIHGVGEGILLKEIRDFLKKEKCVKEFRRGKYGEGENGVTIVTLK